MNINKALVKRIHGKVKQDSNIPYKFHINITNGAFNRTRFEILEKLYHDIQNWCNKHGTVIEISDNSLMAVGTLSFIVRDHKAIDILKESCNGLYDGKLI